MYRMKNKRIKWLLIISGTVAFFGLAVMIAGDIIHHKIEQKMSDMRLGEYRLTSGRVRYNIFNGTITLNELLLKTEEDHDLTDSLKIPIEYVDAEIEKIKIKLRDSDLKALLRNEIQLGTISVYAPNLTFVTLRRDKDLLDVVEQADLQQESRKKKRMSRIQIEKLEILGGSIYWQQLGQNDTLTYQLSGWDTVFEGLSLDSTRSDRQKFLFCDRVSGRIGAFRHAYSNRSNVLGVDKLAWDSRENTLQIKQAAVEPQLSKRDFPRKTEKQADYTEFGIKDLICTGVDFDRFWQEKSLYVDSIYIGTGNLLSNKDRNADVPQREKPMLHSKLQGIGFPLSIRTIFANDVNVTYEEITKYAIHPGVLNFDHIQATISGFTNIGNLSDHYIQVDGKAQVNGAGDLTALIKLPMEPGNNHFEARAMLRDTPLNVLNQMITPLTRVVVKSGEVDCLDFTMKGDDKKAQVDMVFRYHDLEISLMKKKNRERTGLSNVINIALILQNNPDEHGLRVVHREVVRDPNKSVFNYLWKGVASGMVHTIESDAVKRIMAK